MSAHLQKTRLIQQLSLQHSNYWRIRRQKLYPNKFCPQDSRPAGHDITELSKHVNGNSLSWGSPDEVAPPGITDTIEQSKNGWNRTSLSTCLDIRQRPADFILSCPGCGLGTGAQSFRLGNTWQDLHESKHRSGVGWHWRDCGLRLISAGHVKAARSRSSFWLHRHLESHDVLKTGS